MSKSRNLFLARTSLNLSLIGCLLVSAILIASPLNAERRQRGLSAATTDLLAAKEAAKNEFRPDTATTKRISITGDLKDTTKVGAPQKIAINHTAQRSVSEIKEAKANYQSVIRRAFRDAVNASRSNRRKVAQKLRRRINRNSSSLRAFPTSACEDQDLTITYLGGNLPVTGTYRLGEGSDTPLFGGDNLNSLDIGTTATINLGDTQEQQLTITTDTGSMVVESDNATNALMAADGDSLSGLIVAKGGTPGGNLSNELTAWLSPVDNDTFDINSTQFLLTFEYGGNSSFDDLILLVTTSCNVSTEMVIRDSITADPNYTKGGGILDINNMCSDSTLTDCTGQDYTNLQVHYTPSGQDLKLTGIDAIVTTKAFGNKIPAVIEHGNFLLRVYSDPSILQNDAECMNTTPEECQELEINYPTYYPLQWGTTRTNGRFFADKLDKDSVVGNFPSGGLRGQQSGRAQYNRAQFGRTLRTYKISFDLEDEIVLKGGQQNLVSLSYLTDGGQARTIQLVEALEETGPQTDTCIGNTEPYTFTSDLPEARGDGRLGVALRTEPMAAPQEVNLRQSATGVDASCWNIQDSGCTDGRLPLPSNALSNFVSYGLTAVRLDITEPTVITKISGVGSSGLEIYNNWDLDLFIYDSEDAFASDPGITSLTAHFEDNVDLVNTNPPFFGGIESNNGIANRYLEFSFPEFTLQPGTYWVLLVQVNDLNGFRWGHTTVDLGSDIYSSDSIAGQWRDYLVDFGLAPGTAAADIFGRPAS